ncbi:Hypp9535 [Branchiostoma lanceolatum]|uniref:Hypp9535 protein n=1 Tax=Branchiostoma lanceolatum TaxID=7740 RepID=A0A8S4MN71_BRALA|nr:Hypp9535 [Branchiostoma lanceolatum]
MEAVPRMPMLSLELKFSPVEEDEFGPVIRKVTVYSHNFLPWDPC